MYFGGKIAVTYVLWIVRILSTPKVRAMKLVSLSQLPSSLWRTVTLTYKNFCSILKHYSIYFWNLIISICMLGLYSLLKLIVSVFQLFLSSHCADQALISVCP